MAEPIQFWLIRRKTEPNNADRWSTFADESNARACLAEAARLGDLWECVPAVLTVPAPEERGCGTCAPQQSCASCLSQGDDCAENTGVCRCDECWEGSNWQPRSGRKDGE